MIFLISLILMSFMLFRCHKIIYILVKLKNKRQSIMYEIQCNVQLYKLFKIKKEEEGGGGAAGVRIYFRIVFVSMHHSQRMNSV